MTVCGSFEARLAADEQRREANSARRSQQYSNNANVSASAAVVFDKECTFAPKINVRSRCLRTRGYVVVVGVAVGGVVSVVSVVVVVGSEGVEIVCDSVVSERYVCIPLFLVL